MPLKHTTETVLIVLLALMTALAGAIVGLLQVLPSPMIVWSTAFVFSVLYPAFLTPLFRERRADYVFRLLHLAPALILLGWFVLTMLGRAWPEALDVRSWYSIAWTAPAVFIVFCLIALFCASVLRQWATRLALIALILLPFMTVGTAWEIADGPTTVSRALRSHGSIFAGIDSSDGMESESERRLRTELEAMQQRSEQLRSTGYEQSTKSSIGSAKDGITVGDRVRDSLGRGSARAGSSSSVPPRLAGAGPEVEMLILTLLAGYSGILHRRASRRSRA